VSDQRGEILPAGKPLVCVDQYPAQSSAFRQICVDEIPHYPLLRDAVKFEARKREEVGVALEREIAGAEGKVSRLDGWRVEFGDGWVVVRLSGTEPKVRITAEARERARAEALLEWGRALVHRALES